MRYTLTNIQCTHTHTVLMITAGYMGAVSVVTTVKWFWFLFGMAMFLPVCCVVCVLLSNIRFWFLFGMAMFLPVTSLNPRA